MNKIFSENVVSKAIVDILVDNVLIDKLLSELPTQGIVIKDYKMKGTVIDLSK